MTSYDETRLLAKFSQLHFGLIFLVCAVSAAGFAMLYSAAGGSWEPWAGRQLSRFLMCIPVVLFIAVTDIRLWFKYAYKAYFIGLALLIIVELIGFVGMGAQRWVNVGGVNFQPSEMMKIFLVLALARYFHTIHQQNTPHLAFLIPPGIMIVVPVALVLIQPNLGTSFVILMTGIGIMFLAGIGWKKFVFAGCVGLACLPLLWANMHDYQKRRVFTFMNPESDPLGSGYNIMQSKIAIGSGALTGKGFMEGSQSQLSFLPEKETDFIFTVLSEEFGFMGSMTILALYLGIVLVCLRIALRSDSYFGKLIAGGIAIILFLHVFINMAMVMGLIPVVGLPLPLLSYGGSSMISMLIAIAFVLNVYVHQEVPVRRAYDIFD
ncbi:MAG: rod shape-determining protein RodA [Proteobacteria bacterium]|nr:rod shape-determining protein RodA [Pseudomonadota bacterium]